MSYQRFFKKGQTFINHIEDSQVNFIKVIEVYEFYIDIEVLTINVYAVSNNEDFTGQYYTKMDNHYSCEYIVLPSGFHIFANNEIDSKLFQDFLQKA